MLLVSPSWLVCWVDVCACHSVSTRMLWHGSSSLCPPSQARLPPSLSTCSFLCLSSKSPSPVVARIQAARDAGRLTPRDERTLIK